MSQQGLYMCMAVLQRQEEGSLHLALGWWEVLGSFPELGGTGVGVFQTEGPM